MSDKSNKKGEIKQEADFLDIEVAPLPIYLTRPSSVDEGITIRQGLSFFGQSLSIIGNGVSRRHPPAGAVISGAGVLGARVANYFDRQEQYKGLRELEREAKEMRDRVHQWARTQPPVPPESGEYKRNVGLETEPTWRLNLRMIIIIIAQAVSIIGQFRRAATHPEDLENNIWFWFIVLSDAFIPTALFLEAHYQKHNLKNAFEDINTELQQLRFIAAHGQGSQSAAAAAFNGEKKGKKSVVVRADAAEKEKEKREVKAEEQEQEQEESVPLMEKESEQLGPLSSNTSSFHSQSLRTSIARSRSSPGLSRTPALGESGDNDLGINYPSKLTMRKFAVGGKPSIIEVKKEKSYAIRFLASGEEYFKSLKVAEVAANQPVNSQEHAGAEQHYQKALKQFEAFIQAKELQVDDSEETELAYAAIGMRIGNMQYHLAMKNDVKGLLDEADTHLKNAQSIFKKYGIINVDLDKLCKQCTRAIEDRDYEKTVTQGGST